jgi:hypothetical protein
MIMMQIANYPARCIRRSRISAQDTNQKALTNCYEGFIFCSVAVQGGGQKSMIRIVNLFDPIRFAYALKGAKEEYQYG